MTALLFMLAQFYTLTFDVIRNDEVWQMNCKIIPVNSALVEYYIPEMKLVTTLDCDWLFSDSFED